MKNVANVLEKVRNTSSTTLKQKILKANDSELLRKVLKYTYEDQWMYGITEKSIVEYAFHEDDVKYSDIFTLCNKLKNSNINDELRLDVNVFLSSIDDLNVKNMYIGILTKDLRLGANAKLINKVFKGLISEFNIMLAESYFKQKDGFLDGKQFYITNKIDGMRLIAKCEDGDVKFYSRQGQLVDGIDYIADDIKQISGLGNSFILDGELLLRNENGLNSDDLYRETMKVARKKGAKPNLEFHVFDVLNGDLFIDGQDYTHYRIRRQFLDHVFECHNFNSLVKVPVLYFGNDVKEIINQLDIAKANNQEGVMVNVANAIYECKRSKAILKVKSFCDADVRVIGVNEGTGKNVGKLGAITIEFTHDNTIHTCDVGSGFSDQERELYWNSQELLLGKIVTIKYFEVSKNKQGGFGLRFPTWVGRIREDKTEISMY